MQAGRSGGRGSAPGQHRVRDELGVTEVRAQKGWAQLDLLLSYPMGLQEQDLGVGYRVLMGDRQDPRVGSGYGEMQEAGKGGLEALRGQAGGQSGLCNPWAILVLGSSRPVSLTTSRASAPPAHPFPSGHLSLTRSAASFPILGASHCPHKQVLPPPTTTLSPTFLSVQSHS